MYKLCTHHFMCTESEIWISQKLPGDAGAAVSQIF